MRVNPNGCRREIAALPAPMTIMDAPEITLRWLVVLIGAAVDANQDRLWVEMPAANTINAFCDRPLPASLPSSRRPKRGLLPAMRTNAEAIRNAKPGYSINIKGQLEPRALEPVPMLVYSVITRQATKR
jgi:hypothetical protein